MLQLLKLLDTNVVILPSKTLSYIHVTPLSAHGAKLNSSRNVVISPVKSMQATMAGRCKPKERRAPGGRTMKSSEPPCAFCPAPSSSQSALGATVGCPPPEHGPSFLLTASSAVSPPFHGPPFAAACRNDACCACTDTVCSTQIPSKAASYTVCSPRCKYQLFSVRVSAALPYICRQYKACN